MPQVLERAFQNFENHFLEYKNATKLTQPLKASQLLSHIDVLVRKRSGQKFLLEKSIELEKEGFFRDSPWDDPSNQVPALVKGTLLAGHPTSSMEILSELRILAYAMGETTSENYSQQEAAAFLEEVLVHNLEFAFDELTEESRSILSQQERKKIVLHFKFLLANAKLDGIKRKLAEEIKMICEQRPVHTPSVRNLIQTVYQKLDLNEDLEADKLLLHYVNALFSPSPMVVHHPGFDDYAISLRKASDETLEKEAESMGHFLASTGLSNSYMTLMLQFAIEHKPDLVPKLLHLDKYGTSEWERYPKFLKGILSFTFNRHNHEGLYGLKRMLERGLFSRSAVRAGITNLKLINIHHEVEQRIIKSIADPFHEVSGKQYLLGALMAVLGQPAGVGQGNNATCQSARGISMWAQHAPSKLINMITTVVSSNNLIMRFENDDLESMKLGFGLVEKLDHKLDAVSIVLVPHLDKIYNEMMRRASGRGEDPHKWANTALYGQWIPNGFASAYQYATNSIEDFEGFVRLFYASFHPEYNGGRKMVYPNPIGLIITSSKAKLLGFHAISLVRIDEVPSGGSFRAYFLNPNNEGRQNWGQGIRPTVYGNGERHGESSLPVNQFISRVYAFHYNSLLDRSYLPAAPEEEIQSAVKLAKESWGENYIWNNLMKRW